MLMEHLLQLVNEASAIARGSVFPGNEACNPGTSDVGHNLSEFVKKQLNNAWDEHSPKHEGKW
jgi:hypothetical protein